MNSFGKDLTSNVEFDFAEHDGFLLCVGIIAEKSATHNRYGRQTLIEYGVYHRLNALGGADAHLIVNRHTDQSKGLLSASQTDHTPDGLGDTDVVHVPHEQDCLKTADVDPFAQDAVMKHHELLRGILAPGVKSVEEGLTIDLLTIDDGTSLAGDIHAGVTTLCQFLTEIRFCQQFDDLLGRTSSNQNLVQIVVVDGIQQVLRVTISDHLLILNHVQLLHNNLRRQDVTFLNQLGSRNIADHVTINLRHVHARFGNSERMLRSSSEEIAAVSSSSEVLRSREKVTLDRIVRFIKVNAIDIDLCFHQARQRMVGSEDQLLAICLLTPVTNDSRASAAEMMSLTTVNVHNCNVSVKLKKLGRQLLSKQNTRSNYNNNTTITGIKIFKGVLDHTHGLATTRRDDDLTLVVRKHSGKCFLLMGSELNHRSHRVWDYYSRKRSPKEPLVPLEELVQRHLCWCSVELIVIF